MSGLHIKEERMARLPAPKREDLPADWQETWDKVWSTRSPGQGPQSVLMHVPPLAVRVAESGDYLRMHGQLAPEDRELAMLSTAREVESRFEWQAHEPIGLKEGVRPEAIEVVRSKGSTNSLQPRERIIVDVVRSLYREHRLSEDLFKSALDEFGRERLVELVALAGHYGLLGFILNGFEVDIPATAGKTF
jgi:4-carboxymuconolactone decarboxylase